MQPGRYAAIDIGSHSMLLLVADVTTSGRLRPAIEAEKTVRLAERAFESGWIMSSARKRALLGIEEFVDDARQARASLFAAVGTAVFRETRNGREFATEIERRCGLPVDIISGSREASLAYIANALDPALPPVEGHRLVLDIGGGSTELTRGIGHSVLSRCSLRLGAIRLTERHLKGDPPSADECCAMATDIENQMSTLLPAPPESVLLATGGTAVALGRVAQASGYLHGVGGHGAVLSHAALAELIGLFQTLPVKFRRRVPGLPPDRVPYILAGATILHQAMAHLGIDVVRISHNGVRHGCVYELAQRAAPAIH